MRYTNRFNVGDEIKCISATGYSASVDFNDASKIKITILDIRPNRDYQLEVLVEYTDNKQSIFYVPHYHFELVKSKCKLYEIY